MEQTQSALKSGSIPTETPGATFQAIDFDSRAGVSKSHLLGASHSNNGQEINQCCSVENQDFTQMNRGAL